MQPYFKMTRYGYSMFKSFKLKKQEEVSNVAPLHQQAAACWPRFPPFSRIHSFITCLAPVVAVLSHSVVSDSWRPHGQQHTRLPCPSPSPGACSTSCPLSGDTIQPSRPLSSPSPLAFQPFPVSGSFLMSWLFKSGGQSIGASVSASVLLMNSQDWFPLGWTDFISLLSKGLSRVFSNTTPQKHQFFSI